MHLIVGSNREKLSYIIRDFKKFTSTRITTAILQNTHESRRSWMMWMFERSGKQNPNNTHYQFWQQNNHPLALIDPSGTSLKSLTLFDIDNQVVNLKQTVTYFGLVALVG